VCANAVRRVAVCGTKAISLPTDYTTKYVTIRLRQRRLNGYEFSEMYFIVVGSVSAVDKGQMSRLTEGAKTRCFVSRHFRCQ
jgi:hypothetical protein